MDPMFGLPCVTDSKAMDTAKTRNISQEKKLAEKFYELDLGLKYSSVKIMTKKTAVEDFRQAIELSPPRLRTLPNGLSREEKEQYRQLLRKSNSVSMSLSELDSKLADRKNRIAETNSKSTFSLNISDSNDRHYKEDQDQIVSVCGWNSCLPINRQKHAARDAWIRATSTDMKYKQDRTMKTKF